MPSEEAWHIWLLLAGRGFGKTRTGAEWVRARVESGASRRIALVARTPHEVRDIMIQGDSGILSVCPPWNMPIWESSKRRLTWPNGAMAFAFSSYEPDQLRGPQFDAAWCDELASWQYPRLTWNFFLFFGSTQDSLGQPRIWPASGLQPQVRRHHHAQTHRTAQRTRHQSRRRDHQGLLLRQLTEPASRIHPGHRRTIRRNQHRTAGDLRPSSQGGRRSPLEARVDRRPQDRDRSRSGGYIHEGRRHRPGRNLRSQQERRDRDNRRRHQQRRTRPRRRRALLGVKTGASPTTKRLLGARRRLRGDDPRRMG